nr:MAG TPA: hypothetical protein [Caudoviricetes sp.]
MDIVRPQPVSGDITPAAIECDSLSVLPAQKSVAWLWRTDGKTFL